MTFIKKKIDWSWVCVLFLPLPNLFVLHFFLVNIFNLAILFCLNEKTHFVVIAFHLDEWYILRVSVMSKKLFKGNKKDNILNLISLYTSNIIIKVEDIHILLNKILISFHNTLLNSTGYLSQFCIIIPTIQQVTLWRFNSRL